MVELKEIVKNNNMIDCDAYVEDCTDAIHLSYSVSEDKFSDYVLPKGYLWCDMHIAHAKRYIESLVGKAKIPSKKLIMWY